MINLSEVNTLYEFTDEVGLKELQDAILIKTEELLDAYIVSFLDSDSTAYEMPSSFLVNSEIQTLKDHITRLNGILQSCNDEEINDLKELAGIILEGGLIPIPSDKIIVGTGTIDEVVRDNLERDPIRDSRESIRYRYYFVRETGSDPYALYIYEPGENGEWEWRVIGYTKDTLNEYWSKTKETEDCIDAILNGSYETPSSVVEEIVSRSWNKIHEND